ncbi:NADPH-dependent FMN reductase [Haloarchaeobius iranensis]|uniref:NAD(P)H-dependent FMN reductase n=1 Tax=Haloarchaeobius iranensis TaxID=996166 RepID=A0A1G9XXV0_9EURY|nr:NAD(P)H-dependent oxidoreductase [Haloarchaeobius iranensis]SDN01371.1 NAD(P)H-dependent FMN reductase [Haloarchaeobius iranensis]
MPRSPTVVALCGSRRDASKTRTALGLALDTARDEGATTELVDLREYELPALDPTTPDPSDADRLRARVAAADAVLLGTPNYHGSYSGVLKNALDYCSRDEFGGTTVGLLEVAGGSFPGRALDHLRAVARVLNAWTLPVEVAVPRSHETVTDGSVTDDDVADRVRRLGSDLVKSAGVERYPETASAAAGSAPTHCEP